MDRRAIGSAPSACSFLPPKPRSRPAESSAEERRRPPAWCRYGAFDLTFAATQTTSLATPSITCHDLLAQAAPHALVDVAEAWHESRLDHVARTGQVHRMVS